MENNKTKTDFVKVCWRVEDILEKRPNWTKEQAIKFLDEIEDELEVRMIETGWEVIDSNLIGRE